MEIKKDILKPGYYVNSRKIIKWTEELSLTVVDFIRSLVVANLNFFLVGKTGEGKTQLIRDITSRWFGKKGVYLNGAVGGILLGSWFRLGKRDKKEIKEKFGKIPRDLTYDGIIDHIYNEKKEDIYFTSIDNFGCLTEYEQLVHLAIIQRQIRKLKEQEYHITIAASWPLSKDYANFPISKEIAGNFDVFIDLDFLEPLPEDNFLIDMKSYYEKLNLPHVVNPRPIDSPPEDHSKEILAIYNKVKEKAKESRHSFLYEFLKYFLCYNFYPNPIGLFPIDFQPADIQKIWTIYIACSYLYGPPTNNLSAFLDIAKLFAISKVAILKIVYPMGSVRELWDAIEELFNTIRERMNSIFDEVKNDYKQIIEWAKLGMHFLSEVERLIRKYEEGLRRWLRYVFLENARDEFKF